MSRKKGTGKRTDAEYRALAKELRNFTTTDYSKARKLTPAQKGAITKAARVLSEGTFIPVRRKPNESPKDYSKRLQKIRTNEHASGTRGIRGIVMNLPEGAEKARIEGGRIKYELPPIKSKKHGRPRKTYSQKSGYRIRSRKDDDGELKPISARVRDSLRRELVDAMKGMKKPVELFARVGNRVNSRFEIYDDGDLELMLDEIEDRLNEYDIRGQFVVTARSG